jgi:hypothetical protein
MVKQTHYQQQDTSGKNTGHLGEVGGGEKRKKSKKTKPVRGCNEYSFINSPDRYRGYVDTTTEINQLSDNGQCKKCYKNLKQIATLDKSFHGVEMKLQFMTNALEALKNRGSREKDEVIINLQIIRNVLNGLENSSSGEKDEAIRFATTALQGTLETTMNISKYDDVMDKRVGQASESPTPAYNSTTS